MKKLFSVVLLPLAACAAFAADPQPQAMPGQQAPASKPEAKPAKSAGLETEDQKTVYALGVWLGQKLNQQLGVFHLTASEQKTMEMGFLDTLHNKPPKIDLQTYGPKLQEMAQKRAAESAQKEKTASKALFDKISKDKGVEKLASGILFVPEKEGTGPTPKPSDTVKVNYVGTLTNGKEFDSSYKRGQPAEFPLDRVIPCWTEGVQKLKVGGKAKLVCPSEMAYGDTGQPPTIPGGATLLFEVELLEIVKDDKAAAKPETAKKEDKLVIQGGKFK